MIIKGLVAGLEIDLDGQRMDAKWLSESIAEWNRHGRIVTVQFNPEQVAGYCESIQMTKRGPVATVDVVDEKTQLLLNEGSLKQFALSIRKAVVKGSVIVGGKIDQVSLVDKATHKGDIAIVDEGA